MKLTEFIAAHNGVTTDVDGCYGGQCWDLWSAYAQEVFGVPQWATNTTSGWADSVYTHTWERQPLLQQAFDRIDGPTHPTGQPGDVVFWTYGTAWYPVSHVAIVIADQGNYLQCLTQNPGPPQVASLTKAGLLGYLRPKTNTITQETEDNEMQCIIQPNGKNRLVYFDGQTCHDLYHPDQVTALQTVYKKCHGKDLPIFALGSNSAPWYTRLLQAIGQEK